MLEKELSDESLDSGSVTNEEEKATISGETIKVKLINSFEDDTCCLVTLHDDRL